MDLKQNCGLSDAIHQDLQQVFSQFPQIEQVLIFGSRAKGSYREGSDIDLAVFAPAMTDSEFTTLWAHVDSVPIFFKIDLIHWNTLEKEALKQKILAEGHVFYKGHLA